MVALAMLVGSSGCYYDQLQQCQRALRTMTEAREKAQNDLLDCQQELKQKDTQIESLKNEAETRDRSLASLTAENEGLRSALAEAQGIAKEMAGKQLGPVTIINRTLPPEVVSALRDLAKDHPEALEFDEKTGSVRWKSDLLFPLGSDQVSNTDQIQDALRRFAEIVKSPAARDLELVIVGHTDTTRIAKTETLREHKTNWHLSAHRAIAVMRMLANLGVIENRMGVMGYGELRPIADNSTPEGKTRNRRVEIYLVQKGSITGTGSTGVYNSDESGPFVKPSEVGGTGSRSGRTPARAANRGGNTRAPARPAARPPVAPPAGTETTEESSPAPAPPPADPGTAQ